jgi:hypothetical protein
MEVPTHPTSGPAQPESGAARPTRLGRLVRLLPAVALLVVGCKFPEEVTYFPLYVVNYSPNAYIVQTTFKDEVVSDLAVAPRSRTSDSRLAPPVQSVVYYQDCSHKLVTLKLTASLDSILIDLSGSVSTPATMSDDESKGMPEQTLPRPVACP